MDRKILSIGEIRMKVGILLCILMTFVLVADLVQGISQPIPIGGDLDGTLGVQNRDIEITNLRTGDVIITRTAGSGGFVIDGNNFEKGTLIGDYIKMVIKDCKENPKCEITVQYIGQDEIVVKFNLEGIELPCPTVVPCDSCCPICDECLPEANTENCVEFCKEYNECEPCPPKDISGLIVTAVISIIATVTAVGGGMKFYRKKSGEIAQMHRHNGIKAYHDINIRHKNPKYRHRLFKDDPAGFMADVKKINEEGGLI